MRACACVRTRACVRVWVSLADQAEHRNKRNKPSRCKGSQRSAWWGVFRLTGTFHPTGMGSDAARVLLLIPRNLTFPAFCASGRRPKTVDQL